MKLFNQTLQPGKWRIAIVSIALFAGLFLTVTASGGNFDNMYPTSTWGLGSGETCYDGGSSSVVTDNVCRTDNSTLTYWVDDSSPNDISSTGETRIFDIMFNEFDPTDLLVVEEFTPSYSGGSETDIIFQERAAQLSGIANGVTWCDDAVSSEKCDQHYTVFDTDIPSEYIICHEAGHAVGLLHGEDAYPVQLNNLSTLGCLVVPVDQKVLGAHNEGEINAAY